MPKPYTLIRHVDLPAKSFLNDTDQFEARFYREPLEQEQGGLSIMKLAPGVTSFAHRHKTQEEVVFVVSGEVEVKVDREVVSLGAFDALRISPEAARAYRGAGESPATIAVFSAPYSESLMDDVIPVPDFWAD